MAFLKDGVKLLQEFLMSSWLSIWKLEPGMAGPEFGPMKMSLRDVFKQVRNDIID